MGPIPGPLTARCCIHGFDAIAPTGRADQSFTACPPGRDGVATSVTSGEFADNVRRAYLDQDDQVVLAYSPVTGDMYNMQCAAGFTAHMTNGLVIDAVRCVGGNNAVVILW